MNMILSARPALRGSILAVAATLLLASVALPAHAASYRCGAQTTPSSGPGLDFLSPSPCVATQGSPAASAEGRAGDGILRAQSHVVGSVTYPEGRLLTANAQSSIIDSAIVSGLADSGALLTFNVRVTGELSSFASAVAPQGFYHPSVGASYFFRGSLGSGAEGMLIDLSGCTRNAESDIDLCSGLVPPPTLSVDQIIPLSVYAHNGDRLEIGLLLTTSTFALFPGTSSAEAKADFGHTVSWLGLVPQANSGGLILTSSSGFNYVGAAMSDAVPEPATWALMIAGFGWVGATLRRRRAAASAA